MSLDHADDILTIYRESLDRLAASSRDSKEFVPMKGLDFENRLLAVTRLIFVRMAILTPQTPWIRHI